MVASAPARRTTSLAATIGTMPVPLGTLAYRSRVPDSVVSRSAKAMGSWRSDSPHVERSISQPRLWTIMGLRSAPPRGYSGATTVSHLMEPTSISAGEAGFARLYRCCRECDPVHATSVRTPVPPCVSTTRRMVRPRYRCPRTTGSVRKSGMRLAIPGVVSPNRVPYQDHPNHSAAVAITCKNMGDPGTQLGGASAHYAPPRQPTHQECARQKYRSIPGAAYKGPAGPLRGVGDKTSRIPDNPCERLAELG